MSALKKPEINMRARPTELVLMDYSVRRWNVTVPPDVGMDQILLPEFWAHVAVRQLRPFDFVVIFWEDGSQLAELFAREVERGGARMGVWKYKNFEEEDNVPELTPAAREQYEVKFRGPQHKYVVVRMSDRREMISGLSKLEAIKYAQQRENQGI